MNGTTIAELDRSQQPDASLPPLAGWALLALIAVKVLLHLPNLSRYGYFRDELYFLDCARHLDWGYVDHAPLVALYAKVGLLLGGSLPAIRLLSLLAGAALVTLTVVLARELGGNRFAQGLAGLCVLVTPIYLGTQSVLSMNAFEPLFWMGCALVLIRIVRTGDSKLWLPFGALAGLGLMNKHSTALFGVAVATAMLLSPQRRELGRRWIWLGAGVALLLFLPNLLWQVAHDFPTLEDLANVRQTGKNVALSPLDFVAQQALLVHPVNLPIWLAGLAALLGGRLRRYRILGWTYLVLLVVMVALKAKNYYLAPIYPMLLAAGAVTVEGWLGARALTRHRRWPQAAVVVLVAVGGALIAPLTLPFLPPDRYVAYQERLGVAPPKTEVNHQGPLPQLFGDQFGWEELVADVAAAYRSLPAAEREQTGIFASNYGEAGALNLFGPGHGLPSPLCAHQTHSFWGPGDNNPRHLIWLQWPREALEELCGSVEQVGAHHHPWGMAEENRPIYLCRDLRVPLPELWPELTHWN